MKALLIASILGILFCADIRAQDLDLPRAAIADRTTTSSAMAGLAASALGKYKGSQTDETFLNNLLRLQLITGEYAKAIETIKTVRRSSDTNGGSLINLQFEVFAEAEINRVANRLSFETAYRESFKKVFVGMDDKTAFSAERQFTGNPARLESQWTAMLEKHKDKDSISVDDAIELCRAYINYRVYSDSSSITAALLAEESKARYNIEENVRIKTRDGASIVAVIVKPTRIVKAVPAVLFYTTYDQGASDISIPKESAANGYVGVLAYVRGIRTNLDDYVPYENDGRDSYDVIDWISKQLWNNGKVGMFGGSYTGIVQWRTVTKIHPALKTIAPQVATAPGVDFPMENNVPLGFILRSATDNLNYGPLPNDLNQKWFEAGKSYRSMDTLAGKPNRIFQKWLDHPAFDNYWKSYLPTPADYRRINIPILTTTGYFDGAQKGALHYFREHHKYSKNAEHYLVIGPYDHFGSQRIPSQNVYGYDIDPVANVSMRELVYQWLDYTLRDGKKPELLKGKVNYEVMGANIWRHSPSLEKMSNRNLTVYLNEAPSGNFHTLSLTKPSKIGFVDQTVDFADRRTENNNFNPNIVSRDVDFGNSIVLTSSAGNYIPFSTG